MHELIKRFIDCNVPTQTCNLKCPYCYVGQVEGFSGKVRTIGHTPIEVRAALSKKRMGGIILLIFVGRVKRFWEMRFYPLSMKF